MGAACCTHPLDLIKVHLQTSNAQLGANQPKMGIVSQAVKVVKSDGPRGLWSGLSASLFRQGTYSTSRFAIYDVMKHKASPNGEPISTPVRLAMSMVAGAFGGAIGTPGDMVNVRMQNDMKLSPDLRRNYKNCFDGLYRVFSEEGFRKLFSGVEWASSRAVMVSVGQMFFYDIAKENLLATKYPFQFQDNTLTHLLSSFIAGSVATGLAQPIDVLKTRAMNSKPGEFRSPGHLFMFTLRQGPMTFFKGFVPAFIRLGPHTVITLVFKEQLTKHIGFLPTSE